MTSSRASLHAAPPGPPSGVQLSSPRGLYQMPRPEPGCPLIVPAPSQLARYPVSAVPGPDPPSPAGDRTQLPDRTTLPEEKTRLEESRLVTDGTSRLFEPVLE